MLDCRITPALKSLRTATDEEELSRLRRYLAVNIGDRESLRILLGLDPEEFARFYPDMARPELSTEDTIDSFLDKFSSQTPQEPESEAIPAAPPADYASEMLSSLPEMEADSDSAPIPDFQPGTAEYMTQEEKAAALVDIILNHTINFPFCKEFRQKNILDKCWKICYILKVTRHLK